MKRILLATAAVALLAGPVMAQSVVIAPEQRTIIKDYVIKEKVRPFELRITPILSELFNDHQMIVRAMRLRDPLLAEVAFREHNQRILRQLHAEDRGGRIRHTDNPSKERKP